MALLSKDIASKLLATPVKKTGVLSNIVTDKLATSKGSVDQAKISHELEKVLPKPSKFGGLGESIAGISKKTGQAGDYLKRTGNIASYSKSPLVSAAGKITEAAGTLIGGVEDTRQNIINIGEKVKQGKITKAEGIIEAGTSAGLEGITLIAAPFIQAINSGLKITGLDKPLEEGISGGTDFLVNLTSNVFGLSDDKARSRVNSSLNILRGLSMYKGGQIINKGGGLNFVKGSTVMNSPDLALSVLALGAKEEGKDLPTPETLKGIATNTALTFVGKPTTKAKLSASVKVPKQTTLSDIPVQAKLAEPIKLSEKVLNPTKIEINQNISEGHKKSSNKRFEEGNFTQTEIKKGRTKLDSLYEGREIEFDGNKGVVVSKPAYGKVKIKIGDTVKSYDTGLVNATKKPATIKEIKNYLKTTEYDGYSLKPKTETTKLSEKVEIKPFEKVKQESITELDKIFGKNKEPLSKSEQLPVVKPLELSTANKGDILMTEGAKVKVIEPIDKNGDFKVEFLEDHKSKNGFIYHKKGEIRDNLNIVELDNFMEKPKISTKLSEKVKVSDKSVRDNTQSVSIDNGIVTVTNRAGGKKIGEYSFPIEEWKKLDESFGNPNSNKAKFISQKNKEVFPDNYKNLEDNSLVSRIEDSQIMGINKAYEQYKKTQPVEQKTTPKLSEKVQEPVVENLSPAEIKDIMIKPTKLSEAATKSKTVDITPLLKSDKIIEIKPEYTQKQITKIEQHNKGIAKSEKNNITILNTLQDLKREGKTKEFADNKKQVLDVKKELIQEGTKQGTMKEGGIDKGLSSTLFTEKGKKLGAKGKGVHTPIETPTEIIKNEIIKPTTPKTGIRLQLENLRKQKLNLEQKVKNNPKLQKPLNDLNHRIKILSEKIKNIPVRNKKVEIFNEAPPTPDYGTNGEKPIIDYVPEQIFGGDTPGLNILAKRKEGTGRLTKIVNAGLNIGKKAKDIVAGNLGSFLDSIYLINEKGTKTTLGNKVLGLKGNIERVKDGLIKVMDFQGMKNLVEKNKVALDKGFEFIKNANLNELISRNDIVSKIRREKIIDARNNNELYAKRTGEKTDFANKLGMLSNYVAGEIQYRIEQLTSSQRKLIDNRTDLDSKTKAELKNDIVVPQEEITRIQNEVISILPKETQSFMNEYLDKYGKYKDNSKLKQAFDKIGDELVELGLLKNKKENYYHGYITRKTLDLYQDLTGNKISEADMDILLNGKGKGTQRRQLTPEEVSGILKSSKDVTYLYDNDPMNIAYSYLNGVSDLIHRRMITDLLKYIETNKDIKEFLKGLGDQNSELYNHLLEISQPPQNVIMKGINKFLTTSSYGTLALNPNLIAQNTFGAISFGFGKLITNLIAGEGKYGVDVFNPQNRNPTAEFLFNKGLISHRDLDKNINFFSGDASIGEKVKRNIKKYGFEQIMQKSTSLGVKTVQIITANAFMSKFVGNDIKKGESLVDAYNRKLDTLNPKELNEIEGSLAQQVRDIEDTSNLTKSKYRILQNKIFNMFTVWGRSKAASTISRTTNVIDTVYLKIKNILEKNGTQIKDGRVISDIGSVITNMAVPITLISIIVKTIYPDDDSRQEELKKRMVAESFVDNLKYFAFNSLGLTGLNIGVDKISKISDALIKFNEALENKDLDTADNALVDLYKGFFSGPSKLQDVIQGQNVKTTASGEFKYQDKYTMETLGDFVGRLVGLSKPGAEYSQAYTELQKMKKELSKESDTYSTYKSMLNALSQTFPSIPSPQHIDNIVFGTKIDKITKNIQGLNGKQLGFNEWMNEVYKGIEGKQDLKSLAIKNLGEQFVKNTQLNMNEVGKLQNVVKEINSLKSVKIFPDNFGQTINSLKETHPKLYNKFMKQLYNTVSKPGVSPEIAESNSRMIDSKLLGELGGELFASNLARTIGEINTIDSVNKDDYEKLTSLNKIIEVLKDKPLIKEQILISLSELVNKTINPENAQKIYDAIKEFPNIAKLYKKASEVRGATFVENVAKPEETSKMEEIPEKSSGTVTTNKTEIGTLPTYSEKKKQPKLSDLINVKQRQATFPQLSKIPLDTMLDKILKK